MATYVKYDDFLAPNVDRGSLSNLDPAVTPTATIYPDYNQVSVLGPLYLPRVYGKDLTAFEVASSGYVAITLNDIHSLDFMRDNATSNITLKAYSNDSFGINVNEGNVTMMFDGTSNSMSAYASNDMTLTAGDALTLQAYTVNFVIGSDFSLGAKNVALTGYSNVHINAQSGDLTLSADNSNVYVRLLDDNDVPSLMMFAQSNVVTTASNDWIVTASNNASLTTVSGSVMVSGNNGQMLLEMDAATDTMSLTASNELLLTAVNAVNLTSTNNSVNLTAAANQVYVSLDSTTSNLSLYAVSNVSIAADSALNITSADQATLYSSNELSVTAHSNMTFVSYSNYSLTASSNINVEAVTSSLNLTAASGAVFAKLDAPTTSLYIGTSNNISVTASNNISLSASNDYSVTAASGISMTAVANSVTASAAGGAVTMALNDATGGAEFVAANNFSVDAGSNIVLSAASNVLIDATSQSLQLHAASSNMYLTMDAATMNTTLSTASNLNVTSGKSTTLTAGSNMTFDTASNAYIRAVNDTVSIAMTTDDKITYTASRHVFNVGNHDVIVASSNLVRFNGDVEIVGTMNSVNYTETNLTVMDKQITLAYNSNGDPVTDGTENNQSGIVVAGSGATDARSILWNYNVNGTADLGTANVDTEAFWEVKGGQLRLSASNATIGSIAFGFRINQLGELEIVKKIGANGFKRIAKFGRTL